MIMGNSYFGEIIRKYLWKVHVIIMIFVDENASYIGGLRCRILLISANSITVWARCLSISHYS